MKDHLIRLRGALEARRGAYSGSASEIVPLRPVRTRAVRNRGDFGRGAKLSRTQLENELRRVDAALARIESGSFGSCCHCGLEVEVDLLEKDPATAFCRTCFEELSTRRQGSRR